MDDLEEDDSKNEPTPEADHQAAAINPAAEEPASSVSSSQDVAGVDSTALSAQQQPNSSGSPLPVQDEPSTKDFSQTEEQSDYQPQSANQQHSQDNPLQEQAKADDTGVATATDGQSVQTDSGNDVEPMEVDNTSGNEADKTLPEADVSTADEVADMDDTLPAEEAGGESDVYTTAAAAVRTRDLQGELSSEDDDDEIIIADVAGSVGKAADASEAAAKTAADNTEDDWEEEEDKVWN